MAVEEILLAVSARDQATAIFEKVEGAIGKLSKSWLGAGKAAQDAEGHVASAGNIFGLSKGQMLGVGVAGAAVAAGVFEIGKSSLEAASQFQDATAQMAAQANIPVQAANQIGQAFLATAGQSTFSAQEMQSALGPVAGQLQEVLGHTLNVSDSTKVMSASTELAEASGQDLASSTKNVVDVMQVYHQSSAQAGQDATDLFNASRLTGQGVGAVAQSVDRLAGRLGPLAPTLADTSTLMADLAEHGVQGRMSMMAATQSMNTLLSGSKSTDEAIKSLGLRVFDSSGHFVGMGSIISQLQPKLAGMTEEQRLAAEKMLFGATAGRELDGVLLSGAGKWDALKGKITDSNAAHDAAEARSRTLAEENKKLQAAMDDVKVTIGTALMPIIQKLVEAALPVITAIAHWIEHNQKLVAIGLILAGVLGTVIAVVTVVSLVVAAMSLPVLAVVAAIAGLVAIGILVWQHFDAIRTLFDDVTGKNKLMTAAFLILTGPVGLLVELGKQIFDHWSQIVKVFQDVGNAIGGAIGAIGKAGTAVSNMPVIGGALKAMAGIGLSFAEGGVVPGPVGAPQIAVVHGGETIIPVGGSAPFASSSPGVGGGTDQHAVLLQQIVDLLSSIATPQSGDSQTGLAATLSSALASAGYWRNRGFAGAPVSA